MGEEAMSKDTGEQPSRRLSAEQCDGQIICPCIWSNANGTVVVAPHDTPEKKSNFSITHLLVVFLGSSHFSVLCFLFPSAFDLDINLSMP